jgi:hypothetical protein
MSTIINGTSSAITFPDGTIQNTAASAAFINGQAFTSSGTFTIPAGVTGIKVTLAGGGGGGGGTSASSTVPSGGGGNGAVGFQYFNSLTAGNTLTVTVGAAGTAGSSAGGAGGSGGTTSIASGTQTISTATATGGGGGGDQNTGTQGASGTLSGCILSTPFPVTKGGYTGSQIRLPSQGLGSLFGTGSPYPGDFNSAVSGVGFGAGGCGVNGTTGVGGAGTAGLVLIEW